MYFFLVISVVRKRYIYNKKRYLLLVYKKVVLRMVGMLKWSGKGVRPAGQYFKIRFTFKRDPE